MYKCNKDYTGCDAIFCSFEYVKNRKRLLTLGRQGIEHNYRFEHCKYQIFVNIV